MADNTRINEIQDKLLQAMDIINAKALDSVSYDKTIACTIENDKDKKDGKYEVSDGSIIFTAYSTDERYRTGDVVYVTIPQGDYENQKMIIGKKTSDIEQPFNFIKPFDKFFSMTGNLAVIAKAGALTANSIKDENDKLEDCMTYTYLLGKAGSDGWHDVSNQDLINYTQLGIKADFKSWIKNAVKGNYGLSVLLNTEQQNITTKAEAKATTTIYTFTLDSSQMYGNPYNFETNYNQEIVLDLKKQDIGKVIGIKILFYQNANFYDQFNEPIPSSINGFKTEEGTNRYIYYPNQTINDSGYYVADGDILHPNLFIENVEVHFGYDISIFTDDYVEIYTQDRISYKRSTSTETDNSDVNKKEIKMRWVHMKDGTPVDMVANIDEQEANYEIRWYKYRVGAAAADAYCGIYWERIEKATDFNYIFNPDINKQQEKIKAIVIYENNIPYRSNELIFENEEDLPPSEEAQHIMSALNIVCDDGTNGNYMIYGQNFDIKDSKYGDEIRTLSAQFDTDNDGRFQDNDTIIYEESGIEAETIWTFPNPSRSMINLLNENKQPIKDNNNIIGYTLTNEQPKYNIDKNYASSKNNNTISCTYTLNGMVYTTEKVLNFGVAGTKGTEQTLVVNFANSDTNAIDLDNKTKTVYEVIVELYDASGQPIANLENITWSFYKKTHDFLKLGNVNSQICNLTISDTDKLKHGQLYILKVSVGDLETYFNIPLKSSNSCDYIDGPTQIIYQANGEPDFYNYPYKAYNDGEEIKEGIIWEIISTDNASNKSGNYDATINNNKLNPIKTYVKDAPLYGVQCRSGKIVIWTQPILVIQNRWSSNVINKWDGKTIEIDNGNGTILSQALAAGTKNSNNEFSGVMIGEWKHTDSNNQTFDQTGVYGFYNGEMSYAFKEDGTAFIGKSSMARINFDGNESTIYSAGYKDTITNPGGMMINLFNNGNPYISLKSPGNKNSDSYSEMRLDTKAGGSTIYMKKGNRQDITITNSGNIPLQVGSNFKVYWNGDIEANGGSIGNWNILNDGALQSNDQKITLNTASNGSIVIGNNNSGKIVIDASGYGTINMSSNSVLTGGIIKAGTLESNSASDRISLNGYLTVGNQGRLGYLTSGIPGSENKGGIGMDCTIGTITYGEIKVTQANAGLNFGPCYISISNNGIAMGNSDSNKILDFRDFSAEQQLGIYARFA